jgi:hypothetical protein
LFRIVSEPSALERRAYVVKAFSNPLDLTTKPFEVIGMDFVGPIQPNSLQGNNYAALCKALKVKHLKTTAYHRQKNGQTGKFNKKVTEMVRKYIENGFEKWEDILELVAFSYNNSTHSSTSETPYFLNYGRDPVMTIDQFLLPLPSASVTPSDYKSQIMRRLHETF